MLYFQCSRWGVGGAVELTKGHRENCSFMNSGKKTVKETHILIDSHFVLLVLVLTFDLQNGRIPIFWAHSH